MVKKGLSLEEKRTKVLEIFHESDDVYQLKEIEKIAAGRGVTVQSVKEVVQSLVDDDLVHQVRQRARRMTKRSCGAGRPSVAY